jgi:hypothetical protein
MSDRPSFLILVSGKSGLELFSAHYTEDDARTMRDRLASLTGSQVHLIEVPQTEGVVKSTKPAAPAPVAAPAQAPVPVPSITIPPTQEEFEEQTRQMLRANGPRDGFPDDKYVGAFS